MGNIDADVSFPEDYFAYLLGKFEGMPELGVAGTHYIEGDFHSYRDSYINVHHVNGQIQLFRRACFDDIGGYVPIKGGGIDWVAVTTARMKGWLTYSYDERMFHHHRKMGTAGEQRVAGPLPLRQEGLLPGRPSAMATVSRRLPDDQAALCRRGAGVAGRIHLVLGDAHRETGI